MKIHFSQRFKDLVRRAFDQGWAAEELGSRRTLSCSIRSWKRPKPPEYIYWLNGREIPQREAVDLLADKE